MSDKTYHVAEMSYYYGAYVWWCNALPWGELELFAGRENEQIKSGTCKCGAKLQVLAEQKAGS